MPESIGEAHIRAYCRILVSDLPRGVLGCAIAAEILLAVPEAPGRRLPDVTGSAPEIFRALVTWGLLRSMPSARVMAAALTHIAAISPLVAQRSARQWILRLSAFLDEASTLAEAIRRRVPLALLDVIPDAHVGGGIRHSSIRVERDRLASEVAQAKEQAREAEQRARLAAERASAADARASSAEERASAAETRALTVESRAATAQGRVTFAEERAVTATLRAGTAEKRAAAAEARATTADEQARAAMEEMRHASRTAELARLQLSACWQALGEPAEPMLDRIKAERESRAQAEAAVARLQTSINELRQQLAAERASASAAREASARALQLAHDDAVRAAKELKEMRALVGEVRRVERLNEIWSSEREAIRSLLDVERFDDRVLVDVLRTRLDERAAALLDLERVRQLLVAPSDSRPLHEVIEAVLRRR